MTTLIYRAARLDLEITEEDVRKKTIEWYGSARCFNGLMREGEIVEISTDLNLVAHHYMSRCVLELGGYTLGSNIYNVPTTSPWSASLPWYTERPWKFWPWWRRLRVHINHLTPGQDVSGPPHKSTKTVQPNPNADIMGVKLLDFCEKWNFTLGPLSTAYLFNSEADFFIDKIGPKGASQLANLLKSELKFNPKQNPRLWDFSIKYQIIYPQLTQHLLEYLESSGPPSLVEILGDLRGPGVSEQLIKRIDLKSASEALQISLFEALGKINDTQANIHLQLMDEKDFSPAVSDAIIAARQKAKAK